MSSTAVPTANNLTSSPPPQSAPAPSTATQPSQSSQSTQPTTNQPTSPITTAPLPSQTAHAALLTHLHSLGTSHTAPLHARAQLINSASTSVQSQTSLLTSETSALKKQDDGLEKVVEEFGGKLKEIGDVQNWAECIERELLVLEECLRDVEEEE